jgi:hypothetical protein
MAAEIDKNSLADAGERLIHEFQNCVHKIKMEVERVEQGLTKEVMYVDLISAVDSMNRSLEDLRVHLVKKEERAVALKRRR